MGWAISTTTGTLAPLPATTGSRSTGRWRRSKGGRRSGSSALRRRAGAAPQARPLAPPPQSPTVAATPPRKRRRDNASDRDGPGVLITEAGDSMDSRREFGTPVGPVDVGLQRLHGVAIGVDLDALVRLLDAPINHVAERRELVDLLLELRELVGMRVRREWVAHGAGHPRLGQRYVHLLLGVPVSMEQEIPGLHLLHEDILERVELFGAVLLLVSQGRRRSQRAPGSKDEEEQPRYRGPQHDQNTPLHVHDHPSDGRAARVDAVSRGRGGRRCAVSGSG